MTTAAKAPAATRWRIDQRQREAERQAEDRRRGTHLHEAMLALTPVDLSDVDLPVSYDSASDADRALYRRYVETVSNRVAAAARRYGPGSPLVKRLTAAVVAGIGNTPSTLRSALYQLVGLSHCVSGIIGSADRSGNHGRIAGDQSVLILCPSITDRAANAPPCPRPLGRGAVGSGRPRAKPVMT